MEKNSKLNNLLENLYSRIKKRDNISNFQLLENALNYLKINFKNIKKYHVTGTNGKGSVCQLLTDFLVNKYEKVAKFTSPHLVSYNERISINNINIDDKDLLYYLEKILLDDYFKSYSFFELTFIIALNYFHDKKVDCMVIEVGIGGKEDITNYFNYDYSFITNYGLDHIEKLGPTKRDIFKNKFGILKKNGILFTNINTYRKYMENQALKLNSKIYINDLKDIKYISYSPLVFEFDKKVFKTNIIGNFQAENISLVLKYIYTYEKDLIGKIKDVLRDYKHNGRFEKIKDNLYIDGAHNKDAIDKLVSSIRKINFKNLIIVTSILKPKDYEYILKKLSRFSKKLYYLEFLDNRNYKYEEILSRKYNIEKIELKDLILDKKNTYFFTGSIHFIGFIKRYFEGDSNEK